MVKKNLTVNIRVTEGMDKWLEDLAAKMAMSKSDVVRYCINTVMMNNEVAIQLAREGIKNGDITTP